MGAFPVAGGTMINATGANGTGGATPPWGTPPTLTSGGPQPFQPPTGSPGSYGYGASGNTNPTGAPPPTMNPGSTTPAAPVVGSGYGSPTGPFGNAVGNTVQNFLNSNGGYNSAITEQAVQDQAAQMKLQANQNYGDMVTNMGASGVSPNSSAAALESSNFWSQTTAAENAMTAQEFFNMWQSSMANETSVIDTEMGGAAQWKASQPTGLDWASFGASLGESGAELGIMASMI